MNRSKISVLGYALLGLVHQKPSSGYDLRKTFTETALGSFSDSPGAIYPALNRLEKSGLIASKVEDSAGLRRRRIYQLTDTGEKTLKQWLSQPVTRNEIVRGLDELMLRFAFMDRALGPDAAIAFLRSMSSELDGYVPELKQYLRDLGPSMPLSAMLALDSGVRNYETLQHWVVYAVETFEKAAANESNSTFKPARSGGQS